MGKSAHQVRYSDIITQSQHAAARKWSPPSMWQTLFSALRLSAPVTLLGLLPASAAIGSALTYIDPTCLRFDIGGTSTAATVECATPNPNPQDPANVPAKLLLDLPCASYGLRDLGSDRYQLTCAPSNPAATGSGASISISNPSCNAFRLDGATPSYQLSCFTRLEGCTVSASPSSLPVGGGTVTLTARCNAGNPNQFHWEGGGLDAVTESNTTQVRVNQTASFYVGFRNASGGSATAHTSVAVATPPPPPLAPANCILTATPSSLPIGGGITTLNVRCSTGIATQYAWTGPGVQASTNSATQLVTVAASAEFSVVASNATGRSAVAIATVAVAASPPAPSGPITCAGYTQTKILDATFPATGGALYDTSLNIFTGTVGGWGAHDAVVVRFTAPAAPATLSIGLAPLDSGMRTVVLSTYPCDFAVGATTLAMVEAPQPALRLTTSVAPVLPLQLQPGRVYYLNMAHKRGGVFACPSAVCNSVLSLQRPLY